MSKQSNLRNSIFTIYPYKKEGVWMFDDHMIDVKQEAFVSGADDIIERLVHAVGLIHPEKGFTLQFSSKVEDSVFWRGLKTVKGKVCPIIWFTEEK